MSQGLHRPMKQCLTLLLKVHTGTPQNQGKFKRGSQGLIPLVFLAFGGLAMHFPQ